MTKSSITQLWTNQPIWKLWIGYVSVVAFFRITLIYYYFGWNPFEYSFSTIPFINKVTIQGSVITIVHIVIRGVWRKYQSKFISAVLGAGAASIGIIWMLPNITRQTNRDLILGHIGLSLITIIFCGLILLSRFIFLKLIPKPKPPVPRQ